MKKTVSVKAPGTANWILVDASGLTLGRLASRIAVILMGKHRPDYTPHVYASDCVVVINASQIKVTGNKHKEKVYYHHTGWPGGFRKIHYKDLVDKDPCKPLYIAVKGMLPKNKLAALMLKNLKIYANSEHLHLAQKPTAYKINA